MKRLLTVVVFLSAALNTWAQSNNPAPPKSPEKAPATQGPDPSRDPGVRKLTRREKKEALKNLAERYQQFLKDVEPIIQPTEVDTFLILESDAQRDRFIDEFWNHRDPDPKAAGNPYRDNYYDRLVEAYLEQAAGLRHPRRGSEHRPDRPALQQRGLQQERLVEAQGALRLHPVAVVLRLVDAPQRRLVPHEVRRSAHLERHRVERGDARHGVEVARSCDDLGDQRGRAVR